MSLHGGNGNAAVRFKQGAKSLHHHTEGGIGLQVPSPLLSLQTAPTSPCQSHWRFSGLLFNTCKQRYAPGQSPAAWRFLQGRAEFTVGGMGSVLGQRNSSQQGHLLAAERWSESERKLLPDTSCEVGVQEVLCQPLQGRCFPLSKPPSSFLSHPAEKWGMR